MNNFQLLILCLVFNTAYSTLRFTKSSINGISQFGNDVIMTEVTSLRAMTSLRNRCAFACDMSDGCLGYVTRMNRCILIGDSTLPGDVIDIDRTCEMEIYRKLDINEIGA